MIKNDLYAIRVADDFWDFILVCLCYQSFLCCGTYLIAPCRCDDVAKCVHVTIVAIYILFRIALAIVLRAPDAVLRHGDSKVIYIRIAVASVISLYRYRCRVLGFINYDKTSYITNGFLFCESINFTSPRARTCTMITISVYQSVRNTGACQGMIYLPPVICLEVRISFRCQRLMDVDHKHTTGILPHQLVSFLMTGRTGVTVSSGKLFNDDILKRSLRRYELLGDTTHAAEQQCDCINNFSHIFLCQRATDNRFWI